MKEMSVSPNCDFRELERHARDLRKGLSDVKIEVAQFRRWWQSLVPARVSQPDTGELRFRTALYGMLIKYFDTEELITLCFNIGVNWGMLAGSGLDDKARELVLLMERENTMYKLIGEAQRLRPQLEWPTP